MTNSQLARILHGFRKGHRKVNGIHDLGGGGIEVNRGKKGSFVLLKEENEYVAIVQWGELDMHVYTHGPCRRKGYGKRAIEVTMNYMQESGCNFSIVTTEYDFIGRSLVDLGYMKVRDNKFLKIFNSAFFIQEGKLGKNDADGYFWGNPL